MLHFARYILHHDYIQYKRPYIVIYRKEDTTCQHKIDVETISESATFGVT